MARGTAGTRVSGSGVRVSGGTIGIRPGGILLLACLFLAGCRSAIEREAPTLPMEPVRIEADPEGLLPGRFFDAFTLFQDATRAFDAKDFARAEELFAKIPELFPESDLAPEALLNRGLALEAQERWASARELYEQLLTRQPGRFDRGELLFRIGECSERLGDWSGVADAFGPRAASAALPPIKEAEARIRHGIALYHLDRLDEATARLRDGLASYKELQRRPLRFSAYYLGKGFFFLGEVYLRRFDAVSLAVAEDRLEAALEEKARLLTVARAQYVQAIRSYSAEWMTAALYRVGQGFERFYRAVLEAPLPPDLTPQETPEYKEKLREKMEPARRKAVEAHRRNLQLAQEIGVENEWTRASREDLARLLAL